MGQEEKVQRTSDSDSIPSRKLHAAQYGFQRTVSSGTVASASCDLKLFFTLEELPALPCLSLPEKELDSLPSVHTIADNVAFNRPPASGLLSAGSNNQDNSQMGKCLLGVRVPKERNKAEGGVTLTVKILIKAAQRAAVLGTDACCFFPARSWKREGSCPGH